MRLLKHNTIITSVVLLLGVGIAALSAPLLYSDRSKLGGNAIMPAGFGDPLAKANSYDPRTIVLAMIGRYRLLRSYQSNTTIVDDLNRKTDGKIAFQRSKSLRLDWSWKTPDGESSNGVFLSHLGSIRSRVPIEGRIRDARTLDRGLDSVSLSAGQGFTIAGLLVDSEDAFSSFESLVDFKLIASEQLDGVDCFVISASDLEDRTVGFLAFKLWIGKSDFLVRRLTMFLEAHDDRNSFTFTEQYSNIRINEIIPNLTFEKF
jgi:hypothetical protein